VSSKKVFLYFYLVFSFYYEHSQNDVDYIRYARLDPAGSPRMTAMGSALGALGADVSCGAYNPAGTALLSRTDIYYSFGIFFHTNQGIFENNSATKTSPKINFSSFGFGIPYPGKYRNDVRNYLSVSVNQLKNFELQQEVSHPSTLQTMNKDMLLSIVNNSKNGNISPLYEGLAYNTYLLDFDTVSKKFFSFCDTSIAIPVKRSIFEKGRMNETTVSFAQSVGDEWYWGISLGIQNFKFTHELTHTESDAEDKMKIYTVNGNSVTTYQNPPPYYYIPLYGFKSFVFQEGYSTEGKGINLKAGLIYRVNDEVRLGLYVHSPTYFNMSDKYQNTMSTAFDGTTQVLSSSYPEKGGVFNYEMVTPLRMGGSVGWIVKNQLAIGADAEWLSYGTGKYTSDDAQQALDGVNLVISKKYRNTFNFRAGVEWNAYPLFFRAGYVQSGSPFGNLFLGDNVKHIPSVGFGFRQKYFYMDFVLSYMYETSKYYPYLYSNVYAKVINTRVVFSLSAGFKL